VFISVYIKNSVFITVGIDRSLVNCFTLTRFPRETVQAENHINLIAFTWVVLFGGSFKQQGVDLALRMRIS
jgi:hypothetical protein